MWYVYDGLGSVIGELDANNNLTTGRQYDVYGAPRASTQQGGAATSPQGYVGSLGHMTDASTGGLIYMQARYYDPSLGRFMSEDPGCNGTNWYIYAGGNPTNIVDPNGRTKVSWSEYSQDGFWELAGTCATAIAILFMVNKTVPGFKMAVARATNMAVAAASVAVYCFGHAFTGLGLFSKGEEANEMANIAALAPSIAVLMLNGSNATAASGYAQGIATIVICAAVAESLVIAGAIASVGIEDE